MTDPTAIPFDSRLPPPLRVARIAEGLFLPVWIFVASAIPFDQPLAILAVVVQIGLAIAVIVGLKRRRRWAWIAAMALAVYLVVHMVLRMVDLLGASRGVHAHAVGTASLVLVGWVLLTQLVVLACCLALARAWRAELR